MALFFAAALGAAVGSFLGVVIDRVEGCEPSGRKVRILLGRSRCSTCRHQLVWWENIPILSFILLGGRCRKCRAAIPYWLPLIEIAGAVAGVWLAQRASQTMTVITFITIIKIVGAGLLAGALIWIFFSDLVKGLVPDWAVALGAAGAAATKVAKLPAATESFATFILSAFAAAGFFWLLVKATAGKGMGTGDITLAFFLGLWLGWPKIVIGIWLAFLLGAAVALGLIASGRKKIGQTVPFGPFFITGAIISYFYGEKMLLWFL